MPQPDRFSVRELLAWIVRDPWRKLVSLVLAVLLWHYLDAQVSDNDKLGLTLFAAHEAGDLDTSQKLRLFVRLDTNTFSVISYEDAESGERRSSVVLHLAGAKRLIQTLDENPGFVVGIQPSMEQGELVATFSAQDVRAVNGRYEGLIARMDPPRVRVRVGRNVERRVILRRDRVEFVPPSGTSNFLDRLVWDDARFQPEAVTLRGPEPVVARLAESGALFRFAPAALARGARGLEDALEFIPKAGVTAEPETVVLRVPVRVDPQTYSLPDVPVLLHEPDSVRGRFKPRQETVTVEIEAFGTLDGVLSGLRPEELRRWAHENAYLIASVPPDAVSSDSVFNPRLVIRDYFERSDYRMAVPPTIHFVPKNL